MSDEIRYTRDDLNPYLESQGVAAQLRKWMARNPPDEVLRWIISDWAGLQELSSIQIKQLIADLTETKKLEWGAINGDSLPDPIIRLDKPAGIAIAGGSVSVTNPASPYTLRFYVDGELKKTVTDTNSATLESLGAVAGNKIQVCQIQDGVVGWWAKIMVS